MNKTYLTNRSPNKGFTLVELLIVIGILAVLATTAVVILNPAQLLAQARDSQRLNDLGSINSALSLYAADVTSPSFGAAAAGGRCMQDPGVGNGPFTTTTCPVVATRTVTGSGWVDVNLSAISGGSPLPVLPIDPTNNTTYFYGYKNTSSTAQTWKLIGRLESTKYRVRMGTASGTPNPDGGTKSTCTTFVENTCYYETGTDLSL